MFRYSDNYYLRKCYFAREPQVPTQSVMIDKMCSCLAHVYFKSMTYKLKVLAGLEPVLKGGGVDWYVPPADILKGHVALKPEKNAHLKLLSSNGIASLGEEIVRQHHKRMEEEKNRVLLENDINWKKSIELSCKQQWEDSSKEEANRNTLAIQRAIREFYQMYATSINKIESLLFEATANEVERMKEYTYQKMKKEYRDRLKIQATRLYDEYATKLDKEKARLKALFIENVEVSRNSACKVVHDMNVEKRVVVEKLRHLLECQNLACQVYVALKEREECKKEMQLSQHEYKKKVKQMKEQIAMKDFEIHLEIEKDKKRKEFNTIWKEKICHVVKRLQLFIQFCFDTLPDYADFFIDMEKLMMLQLCEVLDNPSAESIFEPVEEKLHTPQPRPHPFYLFCDKGFKPKVDPKLCPKRCTSEDSQLPVIVVNDRLVYAACDNFDKFTDKITSFIYGQRGEDIDFEDKKNYDYYVPIKYTSTQQLQELRLESSLFQILQKERPNVKNVYTECCLCMIPYCFCSPIDSISKNSTIDRDEEEARTSIRSISSGNKIETRSVELKHDREPKWESYMEYIVSKKCKCAKMAKKHLKENLPSYMQTMSKFEEPELPNYETCPLTTLKRLVKNAQRKLPPSPPSPSIESKTHDTATQFSDPNFDFLCTCFSDDELSKLKKHLKLRSVPCSCQTCICSTTEKHYFKVIDDSATHSHLSKSPSTFAMDCAHTLRQVLDDSTELQEIFLKKDCKFD